MKFFYLTWDPQVPKVDKHIRRERSPFAYSGDKELEIVWINGNARLGKLVQEHPEWKLLENDNDLMAKLGIDGRRIDFDYLFLSQAQAEEAMRLANEGKSMKLFAVAAVELPDAGVAPDFHELPRRDSCENCMFRQEWADDEGNGMMAHCVFGLRVGKTGYVGSDTICNLYRDGSERPPVVATEETT